MRLSQKLRLKWERVATRTRLRLLPPVGAALAVLALGVLLPFLPRVDALPPQLEPSLASARIARFLRSHDVLPEAGPTGAIYSSRPAFFWPEREGADSYVFRLSGADGAELAAAQGIRTTFTLIPPPGRLPPGEYRFEVKAVVQGETLPWQEHAFTVRPTPPELDGLLGKMGMDLTAAESDYVLLGFYSDLRSEDDVISAFLQWKTTRGEAKALGKGPPAAWLSTLER